MPTSQSFQAESVGSRDNGCSGAFEWASAPLRASWLEGSPANTRIASPEVLEGKLRARVARCFGWATTLGIGDWETMSRTGSCRPIGVSGLCSLVAEVSKGRRVQESVSVAAGVGGRSLAVRYMLPVSEGAIFTSPSVAVGWRTIREGLLAGGRRPGPWKPRDLHEIAGGTGLGLLVRSVPSTKDWRVTGRQSCSAVVSTAAKSCCRRGRRWAKRFRWRESPVSPTRSVLEATQSSGARL